MPRLTLVLAVLLGACGEVSPGGPAPVLHGEGFFGAPWPDDARRTSAGLDMDGFPLEGTFGVLDKYLEVARTLDGFGLNSPVYLPFDDVLDTDLLPDPGQSTRLDAPVLLLDIDPLSPHRGERVPYTWDVETEDSVWQPRGLLSVQPVWGFPLAPRTTYAVVVTTDIAAPSDEIAALLAPEGAPSEASERLAPLAQTWQDLGLDLSQIAVATVFTTSDPSAEMRAISAAIHEDLPTPPLDQTLTRWDSTRWYDAYEGTLRVPLWQHGTKPYFGEGGAFAFTESGQPLLAGWETVTFVFTVPTVAEQPAGGWPVVINAHGTGGDERSHASGKKLSPAAVLARAGMALFAISQPLHGDRGTGIDPSLVSFNFLNPDSARATIRQGALDQVYLAELLSGRAHCFQVDGDQACTDPGRLAYLGHSQGGITGALAAPFFDGQVSAALLSGAGGGLSITMLQRDTEEFDIDALLAEQLDVTLDELDEHHPLVALIQTLSDVTDPINYGRYWFAEPEHAGARPIDVLMTEGTEDQYTPPPTIEALAGSADLPILDPVSQSSEVATLRGLVGQSLPTSGNLEGWDGAPITGGLAQFPGEDHFPIFDVEEATELYQAFLESSLDGAPPSLEAQR